MVLPSKWEVQTKLRTTQDSKRTSRFWGKWLCLFCKCNQFVVCPAWMLKKRRWASGRGRGQALRKGTATRWQRARERRNAIAKLRLAKRELRWSWKLLVARMKCSDPLSHHTGHQMWGTKVGKATFRPQHLLLKETRGSRALSATLGKQSNDSTWSACFCAKLCGDQKLATSPNDKKENAIAKKTWSKRRGFLSFDPEISRILLRLFQLCLDYFEVVSGIFRLQIGVDGLRHLKKAEEEANEKDVKRN